MPIVVPGRVLIDNDALLSTRVKALIDDAYEAAGIPLSKRWVTQGSWHQGTLSGTTHNGGGAFDLRVWNLTAAEVGRLVNELRIRCGGPVWLRDKAHGWTAGDHIHGIVRDELDLSSGAAWQVKEYDAGRNGLSSGGADYHPRPAWKPFQITHEVRIVAPWTWVYDKSSLASPKLRRIWFRWPFEYVEVVRNREGIWLKNKANNYVWAKRTNYKGSPS